MARTYKSVVNRVISELNDRGMEIIVQEHYMGDTRSPAGLYYGSAQKRGFTHVAETGESLENVYTISCPMPINTPEKLSIFLHEAGHIALGHCEEKALAKRGWGFFDFTDECKKQEIQASRYALRRMREFGIPTEDASKLLTQCIRTYKSDHTFRR